MQIVWNGDPVQIIFKRGKIYRMILTRIKMVQTNLMFVIHLRVGMKRKFIFSRSMETTLSQKRERFRKYKEPDVYNGASTEWPDYLCHFEQVSLWNGWTDSEKVTQLAMSLRCRAQRVLSELSITVLNSYDELKCALTQRFSPPERKAANRCDLRNRRRKHDETLAKYGYSLRRLASAFPTFPSKMRESLTVEQLISGLSCHELKRFV